MKKQFCSTVLLVVVFITTSIAQNQKIAATDAQPVRMHASILYVEETLSKNGAFTVGKKYIWTLTKLTTEQTKQEFFEKIKTELKQYYSTISEESFANQSLVFSITLSSPLTHMQLSEAMRKIDLRIASTNSTKPTMPAAEPQQAIEKK